ncbi:hypothetical protein [Marinobacter sp. F4218]|uniref:hypothetical protein n=1 Tax=Marinobacter sp. F4218 TaxID=2862868 RepID=UPI001C63A15C|nr:hypothetical protein [Marinobacter sp. F4218]MBW7472470.1 hypothetical protein [Marinobacter sp. F4218]
MDDWQGCLAPECQAALVQAKDSVSDRGGTVITVEDFLLALLDACPDIPQFLRSCGVDIDELVRTIQCEQPIVTEVGGEDLLSSQLIEWFARSREISEAPWLSWSVLLKVLSTGVERLGNKAYVAVLELVPHWPGVATDGLPSGVENHTSSPLVVTDPDWMTLAEDVAISVAASQNALLWVRGKRGAGKSCWLQVMLSALERDYLELDLRREAEVLASDLWVLPGVEPGERHAWPVLVLDNMPPSDLELLMGQPKSLAAEMVTAWNGPIVLLGPETTTHGNQRLDQRLGRVLEVCDMPGSSEGQREAILTAHQAAIEKRWNIELPLSVIHFAATRRSECVSTPGEMLQWVERAAARLDLFARRGPLAALSISGRTETLHRQKLVALARSEPQDGMADALAELKLQKAAVEVSWHERRAAGTLRRLSVADLRCELERWVAASSGPVQYVLHCDHQDGDSAGAGSGNLHS